MLSRNVENVSQLKGQSRMNRSPSRLVTLVGGPSAMLGGALWIILWAHFLLTHGPTTSDNRNTFLGLSYYDSTKAREPSNLAAK